jgi:hypothetical protein
MTSRKYNHVQMTEMMCELMSEYPNLPREERQRIEWVKRMAREKKAKTLARFTYYPLGPMSPARQFAMALCQQRGWRFPAASLE